MTDDESSKKKFGEIAVEKGFTTSELVEESLRVQEELAALGMPERIGQIMVKRNSLSKEQRKEVLAAQGKTGVNRIIEGYEILSKLGQGGMGAVFKARKTDLNRIVALKILPPKLSEDDAFLKRFHREARLAAQLNHPNIVGCIDAGVSNRHYFIAMEFAEGRTLSAVLKEKGRLPVEEVLDIARQMAGALKHAHAKGLVHRDIKPGNIILQDDGTVKLCDMGLAKDVLRRDDESQITQAGVAVGTPYYISPEQAQGLNQVDIRADIYSLGATLYHLLVGDVPFRAPSPAAVLVKHFSEELTPPDRACPGVSQPASRLVSIMMAKNPGARFQTPDELLAAVQEAIAGTAPRGPAVQDDTMSYASLGASGSGSLTSLTRTVQVVSTEVKSVGRSRFFVVAAVLSLAISAVAIGVLASQNSPEDGGQPVPTWMEDDEAAPKPGEPLPPAKGSASPGTGPERPSPPEAPAEKPASDLGEFSREVDQIKDQLKDVRSLIEALQRKYERSGGKPAKADLEAGRKLQDTIERLEKELKDTSKRLNSILKK